MPTFNAPSMNGTGVDEVLVDVSTSVSAFVPMLLFFVFFVVAITGYRKQKITSGYGDAALWSTLGGVVASMVALILSTKEGLINLTTLVITIVITIFCAIWLFSSKDKE